MIIIFLEKIDELEYKCISSSAIDETSIEENHLFETIINDISLLTLLEYKEIKIIVSDSIKRTLERKLKVKEEINILSLNKLFYMDIKNVFKYFSLDDINNRIRNYKDLEVNHCEIDLKSTLSETCFIGYGNQYQKINLNPMYINDLIKRHPFPDCKTLNSINLKNNFNINDKSSLDELNNLFHFYEGFVTIKKIILTNEKLVDLKFIENINSVNYKLPFYLFSFLINNNFISEIEIDETVHLYERKYLNTSNYFELIDLKNNFDEINMYIRFYLFLYLFCTFNDNVAYFNFLDSNFQLLSSENNFFFDCD
jgi:hypothetical protein